LPSLVWHTYTSAWITLLLSLEKAAGGKGTLSASNPLPILNLVNVVRTAATLAKQFEDQFSDEDDVYPALLHILTRNGLDGTLKDEPLLGQNADDEDEEEEEEEPDRPRKKIKARVFDDEDVKDAAKGHNLTKALAELRAHGGVREVRGRPFDITAWPAAELRREKDRFN